MSHDRRKAFPNLAAALVQYHAINAALGLPRQDAPIGGGVHVESWTVQRAILCDGPGPTVYLLLDAECLATHGQTPAGHATIDLSGHVAHDRRVDEVPAQRGGAAAFNRRAPVLP